MFKLPRGIPEWGWETPDSSLNDNDSPVEELFEDISYESLLTKNNNIKEPNFVQILLQDSSLYVLVDTGSTISLAGQEFQFDGEVLVTFDLAGHTFTVSLKYLKNMLYAVLLGTDFLQTVGAQLDFKNGITVVSNSYKVGSKYHCLLEPGQESMVMALMPSPLICNASAIIESDNSSKDLRVIPSIVRISSKNMEIPLTIVNQSKETIVVKPGDSVATLNLLGVDDELYEGTVHSNNHNPSCHDGVLRQEFEKLFKFEDTVLDMEEKTKLQDLLWKYKDLFQLPGQDLGHTNILSHKIKLKPDSQVFRSQPYQSNPRIREEISKQVQDMLNKGIISASDSPYSSPVVMVRKPDGTFRFCVDFRKLNSLSLDDCHPIVRVDDSLKSLGSVNAKYFSTMDLQSGFWQLTLDEDAKQLCAFITHDGLYQFEHPQHSLD